MSPETPPPAPIVSPVASQPNAVTNDAETLEAERCFELLATAHLADASVTRGTGFGSTTGLRVGGRIFAMLMKSQLVVKLPKARVDELVASGKGTRLGSARGRPLKEWVTVPVAHRVEWQRLTDDALAFLDGRSV